MEKEKPVFPTKYGEVILEALAAAPPLQLSAKLKRECNDFRTRLRTSQQTYDFLRYISEQTQDEVGYLTQILCKSITHYQRPL